MCGNKHLRSGALLILLTFGLGEASAVVIIDGTTAGFYNAGLGDLSLDGVLGGQTDGATGLHLFPASNSSAGDPLIPPVASEPNLAGADLATQTALGNFLGNTTALGGNWSAATQLIPGTWAVNTETAIVYEIDAGVAGYDNLQVNIGVDNGVFVWFDGVYQLGALAPGGASAFEYSLSTGPVGSGKHYLQVLREDHGGGTGWIISAEAEPATPIIPEPVSIVVWSSMICVAVAVGWRSRNRVL
jgi:hypothetical protein